MKKSIIALMVFLILIQTLVLARAQNASSENTKVSGNFSGFQEKTNEVLSKEIIFPQENIVRLLFNIKQEESLTLEKIILLLCIFLGLLILIQSALIITPFFEGKKSWIGAVIITLIVGIAGAINTFATFLFNFSHVFKVLETWSPIRIALTILVIFAFFYGVKKLTGILRGGIEKERAEQEGTTAGIQVKKLKAMYDIEKDLDK